jgi:uncharacterized YccA/Bax inhibitor family protein
MRTANPALNERAFERAATYDAQATQSQAMTVQGAVNKTLILLFLAFAAATFTWTQFFEGGAAASRPWLIGGLIGGRVLALITIFKPAAAPITAPLYALADGLFLGAVSAMFEEMFSRQLGGGSIVIQAVGLTFGVLLVMLVAYTTGILRATPAFTRGVIAATGAVFLLYMVTWILGMFGVTALNFIHGGGAIGIGFSLFVVGLAAFNLILDFDLIEKGAQQGAPKSMEWYGAFGLMVTLVWLYLEILKLLAKLRGRD